MISLTPDGLGVISYQWSRDGVEISGATATICIGPGGRWKAITAAPSYTDSDGTLESVTSGATSTVVNVNDSPSGEPAIDGNPTQNVVSCSKYINHSRREWSW